MLKRLNRSIKKAKDAIKPGYLTFSKLPIDDKLVLIEGGQGTNINGNMFSMLKELNTNKRWSEYKTVFVVTEKTIENAKARMAFYGFDNVILALRNSKEYCKYLATAKYLMTDNSFPPYFCKRENQVFLNTWHGTPLKTLGKSDRSNTGSPANIQKNYMMSDYALFPNEFTKNVFMKDYDLEYVFCGKSLVANYPRNYIFYDKEQPEEMKKKLGLDGKKLFAYMPTWRGTGRTADTKHQLEETTKILDSFDSRLDDDTVLLVNLHFLLASNIDCSSYKHIRSFSADYDTYEILNACDGLITDYSSVFFDFAATGKKIILFAYDKKDYLDKRGVYIPFEELPFPIVESVEDTIKEMNVENTDVSEAFLNEYCPNGSVNQCSDLFEMMVNSATDKFELVQHQYPDNLCIIYAGDLHPRQLENLRVLIEENSEAYKCLVHFRKNLSREKIEFISSLRDKAGFLGGLNAYQFTFMQALEIIKHRSFHSFKNSASLDEFFEREANSRLHALKPAKVIDFSCGDFVMAGVLSKLTGKKEYIKHGDFYVPSKRFNEREHYINQFEKAAGFAEVDNYQKENDHYLMYTADKEIADSSYRKRSRMKNILPLYMASTKSLKCVSLFSFKAPVKIAMEDTFLMIGGENCEFKMLGGMKRRAKYHIGIYSFEMPAERVLPLPANNKVMLCYRNSLGKLVQCHVYYLSILRNRFLGLRSTMLHDKETSTIAVFRQSTNNNLNIYVRSFITSDKFVERIKQCLAYVLSHFWIGEKANKLVLLYEKNSSKYEESASVLFEKLIDEGYSNAYFICDKNYDHFDTIPQKYRSNILYKNSFKHYLYFFKAKTFIGTEAMVHAIDLKLFNVFALKKIADKNINYIFLQHGVMYMVSLDSEARYLFTRRKLNGKYRVVVSSQAEADHFTQLGRHLPEDLYITGLPKFDRNILLDNADKIVIMPTWRPWEINAARENFTETAYFKMVMRIYSSVPEALRDKVIILPHPLILNELNRLPDSFVNRIVVDAKYDDILKQARILITDYSSIAYDAFYRGSRVIFYWEEKDECIAQYGPTTKLMLNEENVYGEFFYNTDGLTEAIQRNYDNPQPQEFVDKYRKIVQFHDGKNTERLVEFLKQDEII